MFNQIIQRTGRLIFADCIIRRTCNNRLQFEQTPLFRQLIIKDNRLLFVSCKSSKASADDLNEIYVHNRYFGNILSLPVLCVLEEMDLKNPGIYAKGEELGVYLVDRSSFTENDISEVFASILDGTYTYDEVL